MRQSLSPLALVLALAACDGHTDEPIVTPSGDRLDWARPAALTAARTCEDAHAAFKASAITAMELQLAQTERCYLSEQGCMRALGEAAGGDAAPPSASPNAPRDDAAPDDYSKTNTQVEGVDEADIVKTDGTHLYGLFGNDLVVMTSWPAAETRETARVRVAGSPTSFYLADGKAVVLSWVNFYDFLSPEDRADYEQGLRAWDSRLWQGGTLVSVIDLAAATPRVVHEHMVGGYLLDSRRIDDKLYLAQNEYVWIDGVSYWPENLAWDAPRDQIVAAFDALRRRNVAAIEALPLDWWLPRRYELAGGTLSLDDPGTPLTDCADVLAPNVFAGQGLVTVVTYDLDDDRFDAATVSGDWGTVYASTDALYVASTNWNWYGWWDADTATDPAPITTHVHKFSLGSDGVARYRASGNVLGYALDQFAFDEHDGHLRVATTDGFGWWNTGRESESRVTVLELDGSHLVESGVVAGLGKGETIQSVRFMGDLGYVVTFRQVDPLYVIDLRDPAAPKVAGELKVPGFSSYIHPMDAGHLLTIGRDADETGAVGGLKLEIFDVTDPSAPRSVKTAVLGDSWNTWSDAQWDHKAFTYYASRGLLGIPVSGWLEGGDYWSYKSELAVFKIGLDDITHVGSVSHVDLLEQLGVDATCRSWGGWNNAWISRAVFIEDYVYSVSNVGVVVHDTRDFAAGEVAEVLALDPDAYGPSYFYDACAYAE